MIAGAVALLLGCDPNSFGPAPAPTDTGATPGTSIVPRPLEDPRVDGGTPDRSRDAGDDAGRAAPEPLEPDRPLDRDEESDTLGGVRLDLAVRWRNVAGPPQLAEVDLKAIDRLRQSVDGQLVVVLGAAGRIRLDVASRELALPQETSLVGRADRYGHILVWPGGHKYRVIPVGSLRAIFGEGRADVGQVVRGNPAERGAGERLGLATRKIEVSSPMATVMLEMAAVPMAGAGAGMLCRLLLDMAGIDPASEVCTQGEVALAAEFQWIGGGPGIAIEATALTPLDALAPSDLAMPPRGARFMPAGLPEHPRVLFTADELATLRKQAIEVGPTKPPHGLEASNRSDLAMYLVIDGLPVALVPPWQTIMIGGLRPGRYSLQWRSFLGEVVEPAGEQVAPGRTSCGKPLDDLDRDAG